MAIRVGLAISNRALSMDLARRLGEISGGMDITCLSSREKVRESDYDVLIRDEDVDFMAPVSLLFDEIVARYSEKTGRDFFESMNSGICFYTFRSETGGAGATAVSFVFSRLLAGKKQQKVLYIDCAGRMRKMLYIETSEPPKKDTRELEYLIKKEIKYRLAEYTMHDEYGPYTLSIGREIPKLLKNLSLSSRLDSIVINFGTSPDYQPVGRCFLVRNKRDLRCGVMRDERKNELVIANMCESADSDGMLTIAYDPGSFTTSEEGIRIAMDREFAMGIEEIMRKVCDGGGYEEIQG